MQFWEDKIFEREHVLEIGTYEECTFIGCILSSAEMQGCKFLDCIFDACDLSLAKVNNTSLQDVQFINCKMLGVRFSDCNPFGFAIRVCGGILDHSSFYKVNAKNCHFEAVQMLEVDFTEADLSGVCFKDCNLTATVFEYTNLEKSDFRTAYGFSIDPDRNKLKKAKFSLDGIAGLLDKYNIEIHK